MAFTCEKHGKLAEEGKEAAAETPVFWWRKVPLCPKCISDGVKGKKDSFTVYKLTDG